jgi:chromosomal replication initiation ATPase DnaA
MSAPATPSMPRPTGRRVAGQVVSLRLVHHALEVVDIAAGRGQPAVGYTPLVIAGPAGSGKSALVSRMFVEHSLKHHKVVQPNRSQPSAVPPAERFAAAPAMWDGRTLGREVAAALSHDTLHRLRDRFAAPRLVIIDGVEQVTAWDVQRILAHLIDLASAGGTSFVVTMRAHPMASPSVEPSLASRLSGGLVVPMPPAGVRPADVGGDRRVPSLRRVIGATARHHGLAAADLTGPSRRRQVAQARGMAMYLARTLTAQSLQAIGRSCGGRDHTTVLHGIRATEERRARDPGVAAEIERLVEALVRP